MVYGSEKSDSNDDNEEEDIYTFPVSLPLLLINPLTWVVFLFEFLKFVLFTLIDLRAKRFGLPQVYSPTKFVISLLFSLVSLPLKGLVGISNICFWFSRGVGYIHALKKEKEQAQVRMEIEARAREVEAQRRKEEAEEKIILLHIDCWVNTMREDGYTFSDQKKILEALKERYPAYILQKNREGDTPLHYAAKRGMVDIMRMLLREHGADSLAKNAGGDTAFQVLANAHPNKYRQLCADYETDIGSQFIQPHTETLLSDIYKAHKAYLTPGEGNVLCIRIPQNPHDLYLSIPLNALSSSETARYAVNRRIQAYRVYIEAYNAFCVCEGVAVTGLKKLPVLPKDLEDKMQYTFFILPQGFCVLPPEVTAFLLEHPSDYKRLFNPAATSVLESKEEESNANITPLSPFPYIYGITKVAEVQAMRSYLKQAPGNLEKRNKNGETPLLWAVKNNIFSIVEMLLKAGANVEVKDFEGYTPLYWAFESADSVVTRLLLMHVAKKEKWTFGGGFIFWDDRAHRAYKALQDEMKAQLPTMLELNNEACQLCSEMSEKKIGDSLREDRDTIFAKKGELEAHIRTIEVYLRDTNNIKYDLESYGIMGLGLEMVMHNRNCYIKRGNILMREMRGCMEKVRRSIELLTSFHPNQIKKLASEIHSLEFYIAADIAKTRRDPVRMGRSKKAIARMKEARANMDTAIACMNKVKMALKEIYPYRQSAMTIDALDALDKMRPEIDTVSLCMKKTADLIDANKVEDNTALCDLMQVYTTSKKKCVDVHENKADAVQEEDYKQLLDGWLDLCMEEQASPTDQGNQLTALKARRKKEMDRVERQFMTAISKPGTQNAGVTQESQDNLFAFFRTPDETLAPSVAKIDQSFSLL
jgi:ankyrin repeat protein